MMELAQRLLEGDQRTLARVLSLLERGDPEAVQVLKAIDRHSGRAYIVGITGPPGVGKSTIVDRLTQLIRQQGLTVGIVAVDPTSPFTGGALLGDRIRMQRHSLDSGVFIRSVTTRGQAGGLPRVVKAMVRLLDAAGKDIILVETAGVGQTELAVMGVADTVVLTLMPESGDVIQALKAGIMEIADIYLINKADRAGVNQMATAITAMLRMAAVPRVWTPPVMLSRAHSGEGIEELWTKIQEHRELLTASSELKRRRGLRRKEEFLETVAEELNRVCRRMVEEDPGLRDILEAVVRGEAEPYSAAMELLDSRSFLQSWPTSLSG